MKQTEVSYVDILVRNLSYVCSVSSIQRTYSA